MLFLQISRPELLNHKTGAHRRRSGRPRLVIRPHSLSIIPLSLTQLSGKPIHLHFLRNEFQTLTLVVTGQAEFGLRLVFLDSHKAAHRSPASLHVKHMFAVTGQPCPKPVSTQTVHFGISGISPSICSLGSSECPDIPKQLRIAHRNDAGFIGHESV